MPLADSSARQPNRRIRRPAGSASASAPLPPGQGICSSATPLLPKLGSGTPAVMRRVIAKVELGTSELPTLVQVMSGRCSSSTARVGY